MSRLRIFFLPLKDQLTIFPLYVYLNNNSQKTDWHWNQFTDFRVVHNILYLQGFLTSSCLTVTQLLWPAV